VDFTPRPSRDQSERVKERERLIPKVKKIHQQVKGAYGPRRISEELKAEGEACGRTKAATLRQLTIRYILSKHLMAAGSSTI